MKQQVMVYLIMIAGFIINLEATHSSRNFLNNKILNIKEDVTEEVTLKCQADNTEVTSKFFLAIDDMHNDIIELQATNRTLDEEVTYLSSQNKELQADLIKLLKQRKKK